MHLLLVAGLALVPAVARAQLYVGAGVGEGASLEEDLAGAFDASRQASGRLFAGKRFGPWGLEVALFGTDMASAFDASIYSTMSLGVDLKYHLPITSGLELYVRGGFAKTWLGGTTDDWEQPGAEPATAQGTGYDYGVGAQYAFSLVPKTKIGVFLDIGEQVLTLHDETDATLDGKVQMTTVGLVLLTGLGL